MTGGFPVHVETVIAGSSFGSFIARGKCELRALDKAAGG